MEGGKETEHENTDVEFIFVYGTLRVGGVNNYKLDELHAEYIGPYRSIEKYTMYGLLSKSYPVAIKDNNAGNIYGDIYKINKSLLHTLDILEGHPHQYTRELSRFTNGDKTIFAYIYICKNDQLISEIVRSHRFVKLQLGDWLAWCAEVGEKN